MKIEHSSEAKEFFTAESRHQNDIVPKKEIMLRRKKRNKEINAKKRFENLAVCIIIVLFDHFI